jgi:Ca2+-transporting ATPase
VAARLHIEQAVEAAELVSGDLLVLEAGAQVPADARLVKSAALRVDEASLTGERGRGRGGARVRGCRITG